MALPEDLGANSSLPRRPIVNSIGKVGCLPYSTYSGVLPPIMSLGELLIAKIRPAVYEGIAVFVSSDTTEMIVKRVYSVYGQYTQKTQNFVPHVTIW
eukprot:SAG11_NODE_315_length_10858_cov_14.578977_1_plen_97_part_00